MPRRKQHSESDDNDQQTQPHRPLWSGTISFGIVAIAVKMFPAVREHTVHFHQISRHDRKRIRYLKVAEGSDDEVSSDDIIKGYQLNNGKYVTFEAEELEGISAEKSKIIEIDAFVDLSDIDPRYFNRPYYLMPATEAARKPYHLLVRALAQSNRVGIAQMVMHNKEYLVAIRDISGTLCLETMHFSDEIVDPTTLRRSRKAPTLGSRELKMAEQLVTSLSTEFDAAAYRDTYQERLRAAIKRKAKGKPMVLDEPKKPADEKVLNLMEALRQSVDRAKGKTKRKAGSHTQRRKAG